MPDTLQASKVKAPRVKAPKVILFDWHGTLVDTLDAMYQAIEDMLPQLEELGLIDRLVQEGQSKSLDDAKLIRYIRIFRHLHPKILHERRVSRTDIFNVLFGRDIHAKAIAHHAYNQCYRQHFGSVKSIEHGIPTYIRTLKQLGIKVGVATNRSREFLSHEIAQMDNGEWIDLFDTTICGDEVPHYKPEPDIINQALAYLAAIAREDVWYVGDSHTDMVTAKEAGVTRIFYNGGMWEHSWINRLFPANDNNSCRPSAIVDNFDELFDLLENCECDTRKDFGLQLKQSRPARQPPREPPQPRIEPDWHPAVADLTVPKIILFDWHATLVDTLDAMYHAVDDLLPELKELGLLDRLVDPAKSKTIEDSKLVDYVRNYRQLHPKIKADRKISRTDIFEVLFGDDEEAKATAHLAFNRHYRNHYGTVNPFEPQVRSLLLALRNLALGLGVITNRDREFFEHELDAVEGTGWSELFDTTVCGDDTAKRKPYPDQLIRAAENLGSTVSKEIWYVGDSTTDTIAAQTAGVTSVFFNGAQWDQPWLNRIFPGDSKHPHKPDVVVNDFSEFWALVLVCKENAPQVAK